MARGPDVARGMPTSRGRVARADFARLVSEAPAAKSSLPLTHMTDAYHLRDVVEAGVLRPTQCRVFSEPLLYLFYGRPAYRVASKTANNGLDAYWPICFVLRPDAVRAKRIYPFDSGAFQEGLFSAFFHSSMAKEDFELEVDPSTPGRLVRLFWPDERGYFDNRPGPSPRLGAMDFEGKAYSALIRDASAAAYDERHSAIELQTDAELSLRDDVLAVVLPVDFATSALQNALSGMGVLVLPFDTVARHHSANMVGQIYDICRDLYSGRHGGTPCW